MITKKLTVLAMAVAAIAAFAVPASASAAPSITMPAGTLVPAGTALIGTSTNAVTEGTPLGTLTCEHVEVPAKLTQNTGTSVAAVSNGVGTTAGCKAGGSAITINDPTLTSLSATTAGSGTVGLAFSASICSYTGTVGFTYVKESDSIKVGPGTISGGCGNATFSGDFTISTAAGGAVILD